MDALRGGCELSSEGEGPDEEQLEVLLRDDPEMSVTGAVEQQVDGSVERQQQVRYHGHGVQPPGPRVQAAPGPEGLEGEAIGQTCSGI